MRKRREMKGLVSRKTTLKSPQTRKAQVEEIAALDRGQRRWIIAFQVTAGSLGVSGILAIWLGWATRPIVGAIWTIWILAMFIATGFYLRAWRRYWRAVHLMEGTTFLGARNAAARRWWRSGTPLSRATVLAVLVVSIGVYFLEPWPS